MASFLWVTYPDKKKWRMVSFLRVTYPEKYGLIVMGDLPRKKEEWSHSLGDLPRGKKWPHYYG